MPRIKLAYWHGEHGPGDEVDVTDAELAALQRDGRVAEVLGYEIRGTLKTGVTEVVDDSGTSGAADATPPPTGRKRR